MFASVALVNMLNGGLVVAAFLFGSSSVGVKCEGFCGAHLQTVFPRIAPGFMASIDLRLARLSEQIATLMERKAVPPKVEDASARSPSKNRSDELLSAVPIPSVQTRPEGGRKGHGRQRGTQPFASWALCSYLKGNALCTVYPMIWAQGGNEAGGNVQWHGSRN